MDIVKVSPSYTSEQPGVNDELLVKCYHSFQVSSSLREHRNTIINSRCLFFLALLQHGTYIVTR